MGDEDNGDNIVAIYWPHPGHREPLFITWIKFHLNMDK